jgi:hypothetical protein
MAVLRQDLQVPIAGCDFPTAVHASSGAAPAEITAGG